MSVTVAIPTPLRPFTAGHDSIELAGDTVGQVLDGLLAAHTGLKRHLLQDDGRLRNFVSLYLNETDIRHLASTATPVRSGDVLTIVPSIAGGSPATAEAKAPLSHAEMSNVLDLGCRMRGSDVQNSKLAELELRLTREDCPPILNSVRLSPSEVAPP